jgi:WhiB family redox-sensing transcriptional regulator
MRAKAICASCPVQSNCLSWALRTREPYGVWGGLSVEEREQRLMRLGQTSTEQEQAPRRLTRLGQTA